MLQIFSIGEDFHPSKVDGQLIKTSMHESLYGAYTYDFEIKKGRLSITAMNGKLHEATYEYRAYLPWTRKRNNKRLLQAYSHDGAWRQVICNEFGRIFRSENDIYYAMLCRKTRAVSFGTMFFHEQKYRINE